ncbi:hypothetical protein F4553_004450 [Allocatelliglobosispora scoriae]|uniref:Uncharacterized protein n=1 Tax=Allocatelliglobosispora scoriae TaxID=643052 RepID=A0A841BWG7_9ACTN|nr:hypothetical protein [Allocatelliglobosispora scoriae]MBB5871071.1 hypothetical protein [Allocatelliglobosispora scoriae]
MYSFIWRRLPGNAWSKLALSLVLTAGVVTLLWIIVFPWAEPLLPFDDVQVGNGTEVTQEEAPPDDVIPYPTTNNPEPSSAPSAAPSPSVSRSAS